jgi:2-octaprenyl-6-methoxyphenol hydroxylase
VWVENRHDAEKFMTLNKSSFVSALQQRSRGLLGQIDLIVEPDCCPLITLKSNRLVANKTALIAEAAHVLSPIGAQGLNLSMRDVSTLSDLIIKAFNNNQDIANPSLLKSYERQRLSDIKKRYYGVNALNQSVANDNLLMRGLRRFGLRALGGQSPIRSILMQEGLSPNT